LQSAKINRNQSRTIQSKMWNATEALKFTSEHCQQGEKEKASLSKALTNIDNLLSKHQAKNSLTLRYQLESNKTEKIVLFDGKKL
jgi:hypothetical protein